jgi:hypothetical protein
MSDDIQEAAARFMKRKKGKSQPEYIEFDSPFDRIFDFPAIVMLPADEAKYFRNVIHLGCAFQPFMSSCQFRTVHLPLFAGIFTFSNKPISSLSDIAF